jgi:hypothetical protein
MSSEDIIKDLISKIEKETDPMEIFNLDNQILELLAYSLDPLFIIWMSDEKSGYKQNYLGEMYFYGYGFGVSEDLDKAFKAYSNSALLGNSFGQYNLGISFETGLQGTTTKDIKLSLNYISQSAEQNNIKALYKLGSYYQESEPNKAFEYLKKSANFGYNKSIYSVAKCYAFGIGVSEDKNKAIELFTIIKDSSLEAVYHLAVIFHYGFGALKNLMKSYDYYVEVYTLLDNDTDCFTDASFEKITKEVILERIHEIMANTFTDIKKIKEYMSDYCSERFYKHKFKFIIAFLYDKKLDGDYDELYAKIKTLEDQNNKLNSVAKQYVSLTNKYKDLEMKYWYIEENNRVLKNQLEDERKKSYNQPFTAFTNNTNNKKTDPYDILGISKGTSKEFIRKIYLDLARIYHPDKSNNENRELFNYKFRIIKEAYDAIS